jgi:hypothetical protein
VALVISVIAVVRRRNRAAAVAGLALSGLTIFLLFGYPVLMQLCK